MIVVTGASGNVGRPLVAALAAAGEQVTTVSRRPSEGAPPPGVRHRAADLSRAADLKTAFEGADALYLLVPGGGGTLDPRDIVDTAAACGVGRIVLQSSQVTGTRPEAASHAVLREFESAVRASGTEWTILRPGGFASNAFLWADSLRSAHTVAAPFGDVALPVVDPADIAEVAAAVLRGDGHAGRTYVLTGPSAVSPREQAGAFAEVLGTSVRFEELSRDEARAGMLRFMPEPVVEGTLSVLGEPTSEERRVSPDVERVLGRPARPFSAWAERNAAAFRRPDAR
ncbi:NAD(P)H-binding protein [Streptomyces sp. NPDC059442]|uniref:NAD(P)H-binding protein n=1 Tax=Streptomyces sp. NPDC059442 TaxID=3346830 RepID=UPI00369FF11C